jgi:hypothetical protein
LDGEDAKRLFYCYVAEAMIPRVSNVSEKDWRSLAEEAKKCPDGWVYEIVGDYGADDAVPSSAIRGCWKVDGNGRIVGDFIANPNFEMKQ